MKRKAEIVFDTIETILIFGAGFLLLKIMFGFSEGMYAWAELNRMMRGY
jgi:hypothetical protein|tara:strand:- start:208 stop:354 length:147 start_codon:yes stop_codon:yes gene_type:complete